MIGLCYYAIPLMLLYFSRARPMKDLHWILVLFALFIVACGTTHFLDALMFWLPVYRLNALVRFFTALVSSLTVIALWRFIPVALTLKTPDELKRVVDQRTRELEAKNQELEELTQALRNSYEDLEVKVRFRNLELERTVQALRQENAELKARPESQDS